MGLGVVRAAVAVFFERQGHEPIATKAALLVVGIWWIQPVFPVVCDLFQVATTLNPPASWFTIGRAGAGIIYQPHARFTCFFLGECDRFLGDFGSVRLAHALYVPEMLGGCLRHTRLAIQSGSLRDGLGALRASDLGSVYQGPSLHRDGMICISRTQWGSHVPDTVCHSPALSVLWFWVHE